MIRTIWAEVRNGKVQLTEKVEVPEGTKALVTFLSDDENQFWMRASQLSADDVWNNEEDDIYEELF